MVRNRYSHASYRPVYIPLSMIWHSTYPKEIEERGFEDQEYNENNIKNWQIKPTLGRCTESCLDATLQYRPPSSDPCESSWAASWCANATLHLTNIIVKEPLPRISWIFLKKPIQKESSTQFSDLSSFLSVIKTDLK